MGKLKRSDQSGSINDLTVSQGDFRGQLAVLTDSVRQLAGNREVIPGSGTVNDPLTAPYILYVNPYTGRDTFVAGDYATADSGTFADKVRRISNQRLECGYSLASPFRTVNRAVIEAAIITSRDYMDLPGSPCGDLVSIVVAAGVNNVLNGLGGAVSSEWADGFEPTDADLEAFNSSTGGVILPRGCSVISLDLRKTIIRPTYVPSPNDEASDYSNRRAIFKMTGGGYYYGFTFLDKEAADSSHHLLDCFQFASQADLNEFYGKIRTAFGGVSNTGAINNALAVPRTSEYKIVGTFPADGSQTISTDTTSGASPYVYNCSLRSEWGCCGIFADGSQVDGLKSIVVAQFTGVSLQRDLDCWQRYFASNWTSIPDYNTYITIDPDNVRMNPARRSFHIRAVNDAVIQEVSVFAIGHGVHHWAESGAQITITNSNSNFGGCAAVAEGFQPAASVSDGNWTVGRIRVAADLTEETGNVTKIYLGNIEDSQTNNTIQNQNWFNLREALQDSEVNPGIPEIVDNGGYTLRENSYLWIESPTGADYRCLLPATAWDSLNPDRLDFTGTIEDEDGNQPGDPILTGTGADTGQTFPDLAGRRVYIRRLQDSRSTDERRYSLVLNNTDAAARLPLRDYVLQTDETSVTISGQFESTALLTVLQTGGEPPSGAGVAKTANVVLRRVNAPSTWQSNKYYRSGDNVLYDNKHYIAVKDSLDVVFDPTKWGEAYVHMPTTYHAEDFGPNSQPKIIFDNDTDGLDASTTLGYNLATVWTTDTDIIAQYRSATDYQSLYSMLLSFGFSSTDAHTILLPKPKAQRDRNPGTQLDGITPPAGIVNGWDNWNVEFRRPTNIRLFGHAYEWAGYLNYTKALPKYQRELGVINKFTYYFTHVDGGRVYASGFNEEGFIVSNKGLEDLASGKTLSVDQLGADDYTIDFPTFYENLAANDLTVNNSLTLLGIVTGSPTWTQNASYLDTSDKVSIGPFGEVLPALPLSTTTQQGIIQLATAQQAQEFVRDDLAITPSTLIEALGDAVKSVVNARLSLSGSSPVPNTNQSSSTLYLHPYAGNELALYSTITLRWSVVRFSGIPSFSFSSLAGNTNYDIYIYNSGTVLSPTFAAEFVAWSGDTTPPTRGVQDGVWVRNNNPSRRLMGVLRTTSTGQSAVDLGGTIPGAGSANYPVFYLANLYNLYDAKAVYFFGSSWDVATTNWSVVPASVYATAPRISFVQASETLVTAFLDIYNNPAPNDVIVYVAPGIDTTTSPPADAFYGECQTNNTTAGSQWARSLVAGKHDIYYLYRQFSAGTVVNEHAAHGMIVTFKV